MANITHYDPQDDDPIFVQGFVVSFPYQAQSTRARVGTTGPTLAPGEECPTCHGSGYVEDPRDHLIDPCATCSGVGMGALPDED
jgi:DnaJ-class molecular chaperone